MKNPYCAELQRASKRFGDILALDGLDLQVRTGELLAMLGPNGAGKTTAISLLLGLERPDTGSAHLFGQSPLLLDTRRLVGVMMQEVFLQPELRVREHIDLVASYYPNPLTADAVLEMTHTTSLRNRPFGKLSTGQKRQVQFALAICGRPRLLFVDEPTVGLDVQAREMIWNTLRELVEQGTSIILTTHYLEEAESLADRVVVLAKGRTIASGSVNDMQALVARKRITCRTTLTADQVRTWPDVDHASITQERLHITANNAEAIVRRLLAADENLRDLEIRRAGLAEAFIELTKEAA